MQDSNLCGRFVLKKTMKINVRTQLIPAATGIHHYGIHVAPGI